MCYLHLKHILHLFTQILLKEVVCVCVCVCVCMGMHMCYLHLKHILHVLFTQILLKEVVCVCACLHGHACMLFKLKQILHVLFTQILKKCARVCVCVGMTLKAHFAYVIYTHFTQGRCVCVCVCAHTPFCITMMS